MKLRKVREEDAELLVRWRNENASFFSQQEPVTLESHLAWFRDHYLASSQDHMYIIVADGRDVGTIGIMLPNEIQRVLLGDKSLARSGVMSEALQALMDIYPSSVYWLRVLSGNSAAIAFYEKNGFGIDSRQGDYPATMSNRDDYLIMRHQNICILW